MPEADAIAVVAPGIVAMGLGSEYTRRVDPEPRAKREKLDVAAEGDGEAGALGPFVLRPLVDRHVVIASMGGELHSVCSGTKNPSPPRSGRVRCNSFMGSASFERGLALF